MARVIKIRSYERSLSLSRVFSRPAASDKNVFAVPALPFNITRGISSTGAYKAKSAADCAIFFGTTLYALVCPSGIERIIPSFAIHTTS